MSTTVLLLKGSFSLALQIKCGKKIAENFEELLLSDIFAKMAEFFANMFENALLVHYM